jgi:hypothetical protein
MKSIIFYGTYEILHKNIIKIKSDNYYMLKHSIIEDHERLKKYTTFSEIERIIKNNKKRQDLVKEYFIKENLEEEKSNENWYVFEYIPMEMNTFFNTTATKTITTFIKVQNESECSSDSDSESSGYK